MLVYRGKLENNQAIVRIGFQAFLPETFAVGPEQQAVEVPIQEYRALIDTGAQRTCLTRKTILIEKLRRHGKRYIQNVHDAAVHYLYWAHLGLWANGTDDNMGEIRTYFGLATPIEVIDIANNEYFDAILGMDVLKMFDFRFERNGHFEIRLR